MISISRNDAYHQKRIYFKNWFSFCCSGRCHHLTVAVYKDRFWFGFSRSESCEFSTCPAFLPKTTFWWHVFGTIPSSCGTLRRCTACASCKCQAPIRVSPTVRWRCRRKSWPAGRSAIRSWLKTKKIAAGYKLHCLKLNKIRCFWGNAFFIGIQSKLWTFIVERVLMWIASWYSIFTFRNCDEFDWATWKIITVAVIGFKLWIIKLLTILNFQLT